MSCHLFAQATTGEAGDLNGLRVVVQLQQSCPFIGAAAILAPSGRQVGLNHRGVVRFLAHTHTPFLLLCGPKSEEGLERPLQGPEEGGAKARRACAWVI